MKTEIEEQERQAIYDIIAAGERQYDIFDAKHVEKMVQAIYNKLSELRKPSEGCDLNVKPKDIKSELISLQAFISMNLLPEYAGDYEFPYSTSRATIRRVMGIISEHNNKIRERLRRSMAIASAEKQIKQ